MMRGRTMWRYPFFFARAKRSTLPEILHVAFDLRTLTRKRHNRAQPTTFIRSHHHHHPPPQQQQLQRSIWFRHVLRGDRNLRVPCPSISPLKANGRVLTPQSPTGFCPQKTSCLTIYHVPSNPRIHTPHLRHHSLPRPFFKAPASRHRHRPVPHRPSYRPLRPLSRTQPPILFVANRPLPMPRSRCSAAGAQE